MLPLLTNKKIIKDVLFILRIAISMWIGVHSLTIAGFLTANLLTLIGTLIQIFLDGYVYLVYMKAFIKFVDSSMVVMFRTPVHRHVAVHVGPCPCPGTTLKYGTNHFYIFSLIWN